MQHYQRMAGTIRLMLVILGCAAIGCAPLASRAQGSVREKRDSVIARADVWLQTDVPTMNVKLGPQGPGSFEPGATVPCTYVSKHLSGASPKFACRTSAGDELKVKYGGENGEVYGEVAASRLLWALGFGADHMYAVRVICRGCPVDIGEVGREQGDRIVDPAAIERKMPGQELFDSWKWDELAKIDETAGGAPKAERDALMLIAVLLQHSDSKPQQQRVVCVEGSALSDGKCGRPLMMIQDLGVTFGRANPLNQHKHGSVNLAEWEKVKIWKESSKCIGNLSGSVTGTLQDPEIGEEGRAFLARMLTQLSDTQLRDMFDAARVEIRPRVPTRLESGLPTVDEWVAAFKDKRQQITGRRCA